MGFPGGTSGKQPACKNRRHERCGFNPWVGNILWNRKRQPTPVFLPGESLWIEDPGRLQPTGSQSQIRSDLALRTIIQY